MNLPLVLARLRPDEVWSLDGEAYSGLTWLSSTTPPTEQECLAAWPLIELEVHNERQMERRAAAYREEADPLFFYWQAGEGTEQAWLDKRAEIRARYPYAAPPEEG